MNNLSRLLQEIKDNPVMYLDKPSITCLHFFLNGYLDARRDLGLDQEGSGIEGFQEWLEQKEKTEVGHQWSGIILFISRSERSAFHIFFELFEEFIKQKDSSKILENEDKYSANEDNLRFPEFDIYNEILKGIKKRPGMFLGTNSITRLDMVLRGTSQARREVGIPPTDPESKFEDFKSWIEEEYKIDSGQSWAKIILFRSMDEHEALERFFELFEEYLNWNKSSEVNRRAS